LMRENSTVLPLDRLNGVLILSYVGVVGKRPGKDES
jgi:hypothetical protein